MKLLFTHTPEDARITDQFYVAALSLYENVTVLNSIEPR